MNKFAAVFQQPPTIFNLQVPLVEAGKKYGRGQSGKLPVASPGAISANEIREIKTKTAKPRDISENKANMRLPY